MIEDDFEDIDLDELELIKQLDPVYYKKIVNKKQREINKLKKAKLMYELRQLEDCLM